MKRTGNNDSSVKSLLSAVSDSMTASELQLASMQGLISSEIAVHRIKKGMSQLDLAKALGVTQSLVSRWESGETNYTLSTLVSIAEKLDIPMQSPFVPSLPAVPLVNGNHVFITRITANWVTACSSSVPVFQSISSEK